ncbi:flavin monoamine oxidase family protein [Indiicoccus explosivorum]|uniref:flavin monoamine oxidase family protein n=1 Tax=Indiicoccus explosivorum TaxID=1917864 RepID=UPI000B43206C|nr:FAD-dependent oxidoreductase [Indiicoccus explosivorum]
MNNPVIIAGAGLSGLHAAFLLTKQGIDCRVLESRDRIGGRALSTEVPDSPELGRFDLGPTWFWPGEHAIASLVDELKLETFDQYNEGEVLLERFQTQPPERCILQGYAEDRRMRLKGGVQSLIDALAATLPPGTIELETRVTEVRLNETGNVIVEAVRADGKTESIQARAVILAMPPRLTAKYIAFSPSLPRDLLRDIENKPTWMAEQAKAVAVYDRPFWRETGVSGFVLSSVGPLQEIYDASPEQGAGALFGFFGTPAAAREALGEEKVKELVLAQLVKVFGEEAGNPEAILYKDWSADADTASEEDLSPIKAYGTYGQPMVEGEWAQKLLFAGTETDPQYSGHLEGAIRSAESAVSRILSMSRT